MKPSSPFALLIVFGSKKYNKLTHIGNSPAGSFSFKLRLINHSPPTGTSQPQTPFQQQHTGKWHFAQRWPPHLLAWRSAAPYLKRQTERGTQWDQKTPLQFRHSQCQSRHIFIKASVVLSHPINRNIRHFCWRQQLVWPDICSELIQCQWDIHQRHKAGADFSANSLKQHLSRELILCSIHCSSFVLWLHWCMT